MEFEKSKPTILIAEDDVPTNRLFQIYLKSEFKGKVVSAYNGDQAVEQCQVHEPELILMDVNMPYKDGITAIKEIRASGYENPIVVITAYPETKKECLKAGADILIPKPVGKAEFLKQLDKILKDTEKLTC